MQEGNQIILDCLWASNSSTGLGTVGIIKTKDVITNEYNIYVGFVYGPTTEEDDARHLVRNGSKWSTKMLEFFAKNKSEGENQ